VLEVKYGEMATFELIMASIQTHLSVPKPFGSTAASSKVKMHNMSMAADTQATQQPALSQEDQEALQILAEADFSFQVDGDDGDEYIPPTQFPESRTRGGVVTTPVIRRQRALSEADSDEEEQIAATPPMKKVHTLKQVHRIYCVS